MFCKFYVVVFGLLWKLGFIFLVCLANSIISLRDAPFGRPRRGSLRGSLSWVNRGSSRGSLLRSIIAFTLGIKVPQGNHMKPILVIISFEFKKSIC